MWGRKGKQKNCDVNKQNKRLRSEVRESPPFYVLSTTIKKNILSWTSQEQELKWWRAWRSPCPSASNLHHRALLLLLVIVFLLTLQFDSLHWTTTPTHSNSVGQVSFLLQFYLTLLLTLFLKGFALSPSYLLKATKWKPTRSLPLSHIYASSFSELD